MKMTVLESERLKALEPIPKEVESEESVVIH